MNFFTKLFTCFKHKPKQLESDIKFSTLIQQIQNDIIIANESLECVGLEYIEQFFNKKPKADILKRLNYKMSAIEKNLDSGDIQSANNLLVALKSDINELNDPAQNDSQELCPKMTSFEMPVYENGFWKTELISVPLLALSPIALPKIKELTFSSDIQNVLHENEELYLRLKKNKYTTKKKTNEPTKLKISITPELSSDELNDVITHYKKLLTSKNNSK